MDETKVAHALDVIDRNVDAQQRLIDELLDMSRAMSGRIHLDVSPIDFTAVVEEAIAVLKPAAQARNVHIVTVSDGTGQTPVMGDRHRLRQAVWNVLSNAIKFTPSGGHVHVSLAVTGSEAVVEIVDSGEGIDPKLLPHVFERFRQGDGTTTRSHGGLGLGLNIARHLIELHGGTISAASAGRGQGATLTIKLPVALSPLMTGCKPRRKRPTGLWCPAASTA